MRNAHKDMRMLIFMQIILKDFFNTPASPDWHPPHRKNVNK